MDAMVTCRECNEACHPTGLLQKSDYNGKSHFQGEFHCRECDEDFLARVRVEIFVNVYLVGRAFGGQEEGGWWYDYGRPLESTRVETWAGAEALKKMFLESERYSNGGRRSRSSVIGDEEFEVYFEDHFAECFPKEIPHYE